MMSLARDNQNQLGRHASFTRLFENMSQKGVTANTDQSVAPALSALPYEDHHLVPFSQIVQGLIEDVRDHIVYDQHIILALSSLPDYRSLLLE
jgi:hypothetical protein